MGLLRTLVMAVVGPTVLYWMLMGHVFCRMWAQTPEGVTISEWPKSTSQADIDKTIKARKVMIAHAQDAIKGVKGKWDTWVGQYATDDIEFEDFWVKFKGKDEFHTVLELGEKTLDKVEFTVHSEHHGPNEIVVEWDQVMDSPYPPYHMPVLMRVTMFLEKDKAGKERVRRYQEEWWYNKQLNRETTFGPVGMLHENLRWFTARLLLSGYRNGYIFN